MPLPLIRAATLALALTPAAAWAEEPEADGVATVDPADEVDVTHLYAGLVIGLTSLPYDSELGLTTGLFLTPHLSVEGAIRTEALSAFWAGTWWSVGLGARLTPTSPSKVVRPTFGLMYGGGGLTNTYTTSGNTIYENEGGERVGYPTKVTWKKHVSYSRLDLDAGIRWRKKGSLAYIQVTAGLYNIPGSKASEDWESRNKLGVDQQLIDTTFRGIDGAGFSHWFEQGYTTPYLRLVLGMDLF